MKLTNLETAPDYYKDTISLIESAFGYKGGHSFDVDFYPLMSESNRKNNYVLIDKDEVVGHTGVLLREAPLSKDHKLAFIGGVAVREDYRGQGLSSRLLNHALNERASSALFILWSDKTELYHKFGFFPCVELYSCPQIKGDSLFKKASPSPSEWKEIKALYESSDEIRIKRNSHDWEELKRIESSDIYLKFKDNKVSNYFIMNKGMDLGGVIHEYGDLKDHQELRTHGELWASRAIGDATPLYGSLIKIGELQAFKNFVFEFTQGLIEVQSIVEEVRFKFREDLYSLTQKDFLQGIFGPGRLNELEQLPKFFISGLDSI